MRLTWMISLVAVSAVAACGAMPPVATVGDAARANVALAELEQGRALLLSKCGNCHAPPLPASQRSADWPARVDEMAARSKLVAGQRDLIAQYLVAIASR
jgi:cytochrome c5